MFSSRANDFNLFHQRNIVLFIIFLILSEMCEFSYVLRAVLWKSSLTIPIGVPHFYIQMGILILSWL